MSSVATTLGYTQQLSVTGESLPVTYVQSAGTPNLMVSSSGLVQSAGQLPPGSYSASGTMSTSNGLTGTFTFTLRVADSATPKASSVKQNLTLNVEASP